MVENEKLTSKVALLYKACSLLEIPTIVTEQYPQGLGKTVAALSITTKAYEKTAFSCLGDTIIKKAIMDSGITTWIVAGIESHVCVLQTVRDLVHMKIHPIVVQDAISSRTLLDHQSALQEMRAMNARITTTETLIFELLQDAKHPLFKEISRLVK